MSFRRSFISALIPVVWLAAGCALIEDNAQKKSPPSGFIATPVSYYSTQKARYLGTKYKANLEHLSAAIVKDPVTAPLQFANNISSVGGIGFFTHSATKTPDERYLEVVLATPETFQTKDGYSEKVAQLFARYGSELLRVLGSDKDIYRDQELSGYGLNLAWRTVVTEGNGSRVAMARAVAYFHKEQVLSFLRQEINANDLLATAVIFAVEEDGPLQLVSYQSQQAHPDYRPAIREDNLATAPTVAKPNQAATSSKPVTEKQPKTEPSAESTKKTSAAADEAPTNARTVKPAPPKSEASAKTTAAESQDRKELPRSAETVVAKPASKAVASPSDGRSGKLALNQKKESATPPAVPKAPPAEQAESDSSKAKPLPPPSHAVKPSTSERLRDGKGDLDQPKKAAITPAKPVADTTKNQPAATAVTKQTEEAPPTTAEPKSTKGVAFKQAETVESPADEVKPAISTAAKEKPVAPVTKLESRDSSKQSPTASSEDRGASAPLQKSSGSPVTLSKPKSVGAAPPRTKEPEQEVAKAPVPVTRVTPNRTASAPQPTKLPETKKDETNVVAEPIAVPPAAVSSSSPKKAPAAASVARNEPPSNKPARVETAVPDREKPAVKAQPEQLAALTKPHQEASLDNRARLRPAAKPLEGFIIQIAFNDKEKAQSWAEKMEQRGYAVSVTAAGSEGSLRVRLGNFAVRDEAERQLNHLKNDGMKGIIINLPQAFRPEVRSSLP